MKLISYCLVLLSLWLRAGSARGQTSCASPNPPVCTFSAIDVATGQPVTAFCVGRGVRFEQCAGRNVPQTLLFYGVLPGAGTTFLPSCSPPNALPYVYTPTKADVGLVTVSELANVVGRATYYIHTYRVYDPVAPAFSVAPCPGSFALVTVTDATFDSYSVQAGGGATRPILRNQATVVAVPAGASNITVTGHYAANGVCDGVAIQPIAPLLPAQVPAFTRLTLQGPLPSGAATLDVGQLPAGYRYTLQRADASAPGGYRAVADVPANSTSVGLTNGAAGCYRLRRTDPCQLDSAFSPLICTLSLAGQSTAGRNQLLLTDAGPGSSYTITRDGQPLAAFTRIPGGLEDPNVDCGTTYTYRVSAAQAGGGTAVSNPVAVRTQSAVPPARPLLVASFNLHDVVELTPITATGVALPKGSSLHYFRAAGGAAPADFGTVASTRSQRDSTALADLLTQPPCYSAQVIDICQNTSPTSPAACPALLTAAPADPDGNSATLSWTAFTGPDPSIPASYQLQRLATDGTVLSTLAVSGNTAADLTPPTDQQVLRYRLRISGAGLPAGTVSYSNRATVARRLLLTIPTAFTPNGDGLNDVLEVKGKYLRDYTFVVVDRNGLEVFRGTQRSQTWDGTIRGHAPVLGAYAWRFEQTDEDGRPFIATGAVTLLK